MSLAPADWALLLEDDRPCALYLQRFLSDHQVAFPHSLYDQHGRYVFAAPQKAKVLADALLKAVTHGKDNELFVLAIDLLEAADEMAALERAVCLARAKHHQVLVICPWPAGVPIPGKMPRPVKEPLVFTAADVDRLVQQVCTMQLHQAFASVKHAFGRFGVPVICAAQSDTVAWILHRMRRLRVQERGVR